MGAINTKILQYEQIIIALLEEYKTEYQEYVWGNIKDILVVDKDHRHYQLIATGWRKNRHIHRLLVHLHIHDDGKIWIEINNTEVEVARELVLKGVPSSDIVLGFQTEYVRSMTEYAVS